MSCLMFLVFLFPLPMCRARDAWFQRENGGGGDGDGDEDKARQAGEGGVGTAAGMGAAALKENSVKQAFRRC